VFNLSLLFKLSFSAILPAAFSLGRQEINSAWYTLRFTNFALSGRDFEVTNQFLRTSKQQMRYMGVPHNIFHNQTPSHCST
jgi:hypothetical protein